MRFEFATATNIIFGSDTVNELPQLAQDLGSRAFVVTGHTDERARPLLEKLKKGNIDYVTFNVSTEPTTHVALSGVRHAVQPGYWRWRGKCPGYGKSHRSAFDKQR